MGAIESIKKGLIVSCQALEDEPLHSSFIMSRMAAAAEQGGAVCIRANSFDDIKAIKNTVKLPIIGIIKKDYDEYEPYITPTMEEVDKVVQAGADIVAVDATKRLRPQNLDIEQFFKNIKEKYPQIILMADISTFDEGVQADALGFDLVSTTLSGYTEYSTKSNKPDFELIDKLSKAIRVPLIAEGKIWTPEEAVKALDMGAYAVVVGAAITRPQFITKRFAGAMINKS